MELNWWQPKSNTVSWFPRHQHNRQGILLFLFFSEVYLSHPPLMVILMMELNQWQPKSNTVSWFPCCQRNCLGILLFLFFAEVYLSRTSLVVILTMELNQWQPKSNTVSCFTCCHCLSSCCVNFFAEVWLFAPSVDGDSSNGTESVAAKKQHCDMFPSPSAQWPRNSLVFIFCRSITLGTLHWLCLKQWSWIGGSPKATQCLGSLAVSVITWEFLFLFFAEV